MHTHTWRCAKRELDELNKKCSSWLPPHFCGAEQSSEDKAIWQQKHRAEEALCTWNDSNAQLKNY